MAYQMDHQDQMVVLFDGNIDYSFSFNFAKLSVMKIEEKGTMN